MLSVTVGIDDVRLGCDSFPPFATGWVKSYQVFLLNALPKPSIGR